MLPAALRCRQLEVDKLDEPALCYDGDELRGE